MSYLAPLLLPLSVAFGSALILTPLCRRVALALGVLDRPGGKKIHAQPTPLLGGPAIAVAHTAGVLAAGPVDQVSATILVAGGLILLLGIHDDLDPHAEGVRWWLRLLFQGFLAVFVIYPGITLGFLRTPWLSIPIILLWIVGITNAFNLLDNMNGLSAGVAAIAGLTFAVLAARYIEVGPEQLPTARAAASLAGACLGFLPWNFRSRIFMGDAGSLFIGFTLACLAAWAVGGAPPPPRPSSSRCWSWPIPSSTRHWWWCCACGAGNRQWWAAATTPPTGWSTSGWAGSRSSCSSTFSPCRTLSRPSWSLR